MRCALSIFLTLSVACGGSAPKPKPVPTPVAPVVIEAGPSEEEIAKKKARVERGLALMESMTAIVNDLADTATNAKGCKALAVGFNAWADKYADGGEVDGKAVSKTEALNLEGTELAISSDEKGEQHEASEAVYAQARERYKALPILGRCGESRALARGLKDGFGAVIGPIPDDFSGWYHSADADESDTATD